MSKLTAVRLFICLTLIGFVFAGVVEDTALAAQESDQLSLLPSSSQPADGEGGLELYAAYPALKDISGNTFTFQVDLIYKGEGTRTFELSATPIPHWVVSIKSVFQEIELPEISLEPGKDPPESVRVVLEPIPGELPDPGEYKTTLTAASGDIKDSIELKAVVADKYRFAFFTESGKLSAEITAGKENHIATSVMNTGTATIDKITITGGKPEYWNLKFVPDKIENLEPGFAQEVDIVITPTKEAPAGDYMLKMRAVCNQYRVDLDLRVTVLTPTTWAWVAVVIVLVVIGGVAVVFRRLGRR